MLLNAVRGRLNFPRRTIHGLPAAEDVEPLTLEVLKARGVRKPCQMAGGKDRFGVPKGIRRMNIAFDHFIVHQAIDHLGALAIRGAEHQRVP